MSESTHYRAGDVPRWDDYARFWKQMLHWLAG